MKKMNDEANIGKSQTVNAGFDELLANLKASDDFFSKFKKKANIHSI